MQSIKYKERADELIVTYFTHKITNIQLAELQDWLLEKENQDYFLKQQEIWLGKLTAEDSERFNAYKAYNRFRLRTDISNTRVNFRFNVRPWLNLAAVIVILLTVGGGAYWYGSKSVTSHFKDIKLEAPLGSRNKVFLPDGTLVWLNAGSNISYSQGFGINDRIVKLEGEAYFEVTKNENLPFSVKTKELFVSVLGTKFNFRNYADDKEAIVTLIQGKVNVEEQVRATGIIELKPNQRIMLNKHNGNVKIQSLNAKRVSNWTKGILTFDEDKLPDIVRELERAYNIDIELKDTTLNNLRFYGKFALTSQSIDEVLNAIASTGKLRFLRNEKNISIYHN